MPLNMIVCCKQVLDPEAPPASFKIDPSTNKVIPPPGVPPVVSPFDEQAVEAALRIKDQQGGKITVLSLGNNLLRDVVKKPLSMGADELLLCGRQAADWDAGQVGTGIAEILGIPSVTVAKKVEATDGKAKVERVIADGYQVIEVTLPALITVSNELGEARYATLKGIMAASKKQPTVWKPADIGLEPSQVGTAGRRAKLLKLFQPVKEGKCEILEADTPAEAGTKLAAKLREAKVI